jgi:hypothetical protein
VVMGVYFPSCGYCTRGRVTIFLSFSEQ